jgi:serine/threonine-protein kinase RsbW
MEGTGGVVALTIPAKAEYMVLPRLALTGLARIRALEADTVADLKLALTEACSNSIRHAYDTGSHGNVQVRYELTDDKLAVEVTDDGDGFDPATMRAPSGELDEGGLGIAIIRALVDELDIGPRPDGRGSRLRFTKYLS